MANPRPRRRAPGASRVRFRAQFDARLLQAAQQLLQELQMASKHVGQLAKELGQIATEAARALREAAQKLEQELSQAQENAREIARLRQQMEALLPAEGGYNIARATRGGSQR